MLQTTLPILLSGLMAALFTAHPAVARACSCVPNAISLATPSDGATDVPIDIAPIIHGFFEEETVTLTRESGDSVDFELRTALGLGHCGGRIGELTLSADLEPNTRYVLRADPSDSGSAPTKITFTTGSDRVPEDALSAPTLRATFLRGNPIGDTCASDVQGCIGVDDEGAQIELTFVSGEDTQQVAVLEGDSQVTVRSVPDCVEARARDAAGRRSAATVLCGKELNVRAANEADYRDYHRLNCDDGTIRQSGAPADAGVPPSVDESDGGGGNEAEKAGASSSCSISVQRSARSLLALLSTLAVIFVARRRRPSYALARERHETAPIPVTQASTHH